MRDKGVAMALKAVALMIGGFALGYCIAKFYSWYLMWLFYTTGNIAVVFAIFTYTGTRTLIDLSLYFSLFAAAMYIGLYVGDRPGGAARK